MNEHGAVKTGRTGEGGGGIGRDGTRMRGRDGTRVGVSEG